MRWLARIALALWIAGVVLVHFVVPLYLLAIYPQLPEGRLGRFGLTLASPALENFWFRLVACALFIGIGLLLVKATLRAMERPEREKKRVQ